MCQSTCKELKENEESDKFGLLAWESLPKFSLQTSLQLALLILSISLLYLRPAEPSNPNWKK